MEPLFPALPELSTLTDEQLDEQLAANVERSRAIKANDQETLGDRNAQAILEDVAVGKEQREALKAEKAARAEAVATYESSLEALTSDIEETVELTAEEAAEALAAEEAAAVEVLTLSAEEQAAADAAEAEALAAAAIQPRRPLPAPGRHQVQPLVENSDPRRVPFLASAGMPGVQIGQELDDQGIASAMIRALRATTASRGAEKVVVASANYYDMIPEERRLHEFQRGGGSNDAKIRALTDPRGEVMVASTSAYCAPLTPYYFQQNLAVQDRPVRDGLAGFATDRGGITWTPPPTIADITTAVGVITAGAVEDGGTFATKSCQVMDCPDIETQQVWSVYKCLQFGNLQSRSYPELIAADNNQAMAAWARLGDGLLLNAINAGSTQVTGALNNGAVNTYLGHLLQAAAGIRSYYRMQSQVKMRALAPDWLRDLLVLDIVRSEFQRFAYQQDGVEQLLAMFNINVSFYLDENVNDNNVAVAPAQIFPLQGAGAVIPFPTNVMTYMFPEGTWLFLDAGVLDLGIVRDSILNSTNSYELFAESFEAAAKVGAVSYAINSTICPSGAVTAPGEAIGC